MKATVLFITLIVLIAGCKQQTKEDRTPFEYDDGQIFVTLTLNDSIEGTFIFDTRISGLYFDSAFVAASPFEQTLLGEVEIESTGIPKRKPIPIIKHVIHFKIGDKQFRSGQTPILNLSGFIDDNIAGIIGLKFFNNSILNVNFKEKYLAVFDQAYRSKLLQLNHTDFEIVDDQILTQALIHIDTENNFSGLFKVDLSCPDGVLLTPKTALNYGFYDNEEKVLRINSDDDQRSRDTRMYELRANSIIFGENSLRKISLSFSENAANAFSSPNCIGTLGAPLFAKFNFYIDFPKNKIYFDPLKNIHKDDSSTALGFMSKTKSEGEDRYIVIDGLYATTTVQSGLQAGISMMAINNRKINDIPKEDFDLKLLVPDESSK